MLDSSCLPLPIQALTRIFFPSLANSITFCCSSDNIIFLILFHPNYCICRNSNPSSIRIKFKIHIYTLLKIMYSLLTVTDVSFLYSSTLRNLNYFYTHLTSLYIVFYLLSINFSDFTLITFIFHYTH